MSMREKIADRIKHHTADAFWTPEGLADAVLDALMEPTDEMIGAMYECHEKSAPVYFYRSAIKAAKEGG